MNEPKHNHPLWETLVMIGSFLMLWVWFLAHSAAQRTPGKYLHPLWQTPLVVAVIVLIVILVRRARRLQRALRGDDNPMASRFPPPNGHTRK